MIGGGFLNFSSLSTANWFEGFFWGCVFGHSSVALHSEATKAEPEKMTPAEKVNAVWVQSKQILINFCTCIYSFTGILSWASKASLLAIGNALPCISALGYLANSIAHGTRMGETLSETIKDFLRYEQIKNLHGKKELAFSITRNCVRVAFITCLIAWSLLGAWQAFFGGNEFEDHLFAALYYGIIFFCVHLGLTVLGSKKASTKASS